MIQLKQRIVPILKKNGVLSSALFGSHSRGEASLDSDVDILVEMPRGKSLVDFVGLKQELEGELGMRVDLVTPQAISPDLWNYIKKDLVSIYAG
ncbi:MAG: hypothetical protein G01um101416_734 [Microgenomates group bacterium Gr01-1014_16]|nr:MAG: hypothetical protein G01um101416_734 [Microgenomates group bacterium Gr01-1014_16]